jgi:hypothetical protein
MFTQIKPSGTVAEAKIAGAEALGTRRDVFRQNVTGLFAFVTIAVQFGLIVIVLNYWQLESLSLDRLMQVAFAGFVVHHFLPMRFRLSFFAFLSLLVVITGVGHLGQTYLWDGYVEG